MFSFHCLLWLQLMILYLFFKEYALVNNPIIKTDHLDLTIFILKLDPSVYLASATPSPILSSTVRYKFNFRCFFIRERSHITSKMK